MYIFTEKDKSAILEMFTALLVYYFINEVPKEITKFNDSHQYKMFQSGCNFANDVYGTRICDANRSQTSASQS